jgi:hypothetical protein
MKIRDDTREPGELKEALMDIQCGKQRHFVADGPEEMESRNNYKQRLKTEIKHSSRRKHKHKNKDEGRSRKKDDYDKKARVMVGASAINSSSSYSVDSRL